MRVVAWTAGVAWFLICTSLSYARFAHHTAHPVVVQHGAVTPPPVKTEPTAAPANAPVEQNEPENPAWDHSLDSAPERVEIPARPTAPAPAVPAVPLPPPPPIRTLTAPPPASAATSAPAPATTHPLKAHKTSKSKAVDRTNAGEQPGPATFQPAARCLECGAPAASWVEVDGQRVGYCRKHYSRMDRPRGSRKRGAAKTQEPASSSEIGSTGATVAEPAPAQQEPASAQCRGLTKDGTRCRRKTRDPSGFCYQHRPR